jgi:type I restriction enzyme S subunit
MPQVASTEFLVFKPKAPAQRGLLYCLFRDQTLKQRLEGMVTGTSKSHQRISPPALLKTGVLCADPSLFFSFEQSISPALLRMLANRRENLTLATMRDLLLPKLMSGEIRVRDAEKVLEAMA